VWQRRGTDPAGADLKAAGALPEKDRRPR